MLSTVRCFQLGMLISLLTACAGGGSLTVSNPTPVARTSAAPPLSAGSITEYGSLPPLSSPERITLGPDGAMWFTENAIDQVGRLDPITSRMTQFYAMPGCAPVGIATGPDGNIWYTCQGTNQITRMATNGLGTNFSVPTANSNLSSITKGPDQALWFTESDANNIGRISTSGSITEFHIPTMNAQPESITTGPDGNLWFTEYASSKIGRITPAGSITEFPTTLPLEGPWGITSDASTGTLWFTELDSDHIETMTTAGTVIATYAIPPSGGNPHHITFNEADGDLWFTQTGSSGPDAIGRITPMGAITEFSIPTANSAPSGIANAPNGIWFTEKSGNAIGKIVP